VHDGRTLRIALLALALSACASRPPDAIARRLVECGLLSSGTVPPYTIDNRFYAPNDCYRECLAGASCDELHQRLCGSSIALPLRCDERCAYHCPDGSLVDPTAQCDGVSQCADGSDERGCGTAECSDGRMILAAQRCDGIVQCSTASDERDCPGTCTTTSGYVLDLERSPYAICNGTRDCADGEDEANCARFTCASGMVVTYDASRSIVCDGIGQCWSDARPADEAGCPPPAALTFTCP
jgi:hypothetical protein